VSASSERMVVLPKALHARPAGQVARAAARFEGPVTLAAGERSVDARSVLAVMSLGAVAGAEVLVSASQTEAVEEIARILLEPDA
jgi:phosphocarrier protein HPr